VKRLKYVASLNDEVLTEGTKPDHEILYVDISRVDSTAGIIQRESLVFEKAPSRARRLVRDGDVIVSTVRTYLRAIAPIAHPEPNLVVSTGFAVVRPGLDIDSGFLAYALRAPYFVDRVVAYSNGVSYPAINETELATFPVILPPLSEQRAIARFLDRETAKIDALIAKNERLIELLQEKRAALITHAVTKGLDPSVPMRNSGIEWLGQIPAHWEFAAAGRLIDHIEQGWSPLAEDRLADPNEWAVIKLSAVSKGVFHEAEHKALPANISPDTRYEIRHGDFLMTRANTPDLVGDVCVVQSTRPRLMLCDLVYRLRLRFDVVLPEFLAFWFLSRGGRFQIEVEARGSSQSMVKVSQILIRAWTVALPPVTEQRAIADFLNRETAKIDTVVAKVREVIGRLKEYRTALISAAVTGKIDVREEAT
jgi:type I restriction enzyme S subunit